MARSGIVEEGHAFRDRQHRSDGSGTIFAQVRDISGKRKHRWTVWGENRAPKGCPTNLRPKLAKCIELRKGSARAEGATKAENSGTEEGEETTLYGKDSGISQDEIPLSRQKYQN